MLETLATPCSLRIESSESGRHVGGAVQSLRIPGCRGDLGRKTGRAARPHGRRRQHLYPQQDHAKGDSSRLGDCKRQVQPPVPIREGVTQPGNGDGYSSAEPRMGVPVLRTIRQRHCTVGIPGRRRGR